MTWLDDVRNLLTDCTPQTVKDTGLGVDFLDRRGTLLLSYRVAIDVLAVQPSILGKVLDPPTKIDDVLSGILGHIGDLVVLTDAYACPTDKIPLLEQFHAVYVCENDVTAFRYFVP